MPKKQLHNLPGTCQRLARRLAEGCMRVEIVMMQAPPPLPEREAEATEDELGEQSFFLHLKDTSLFQTKIWQTTQAQQKLGRVADSIAFRAAEMYKKRVPSSGRSHIPKLNKLLGTCQRQAFSPDAGYLLHDIFGHRTLNEKQQLQIRMLNSRVLLVEDQRLCRHWLT